MKKFYMLLVAVVVLAALAAPVAAFAGSPDPTREVRGHITAISSSQVTIKPAFGPAVTLKLTSATRITVNNHPAPLSALKVGNLVEARYGRTTMVALWINKDM